MTGPWPRLPLAEVLTERAEVPDPGKIASGEVRIISKIGFDDGQIQLRGDSGTKTGMILVRPGDLVVSGINAAKGAIAIYDMQASEPITATIHYGAYIPNRSKVDTMFLWWLLRSSTFRAILREHLPGGIKTELKAKRLLQVPVPLPPLLEQRRIVARIEEVAGRIEEAWRLRREAAEELYALENGVAELCFQNLLSIGTPSYRFEEVCEQITVGHVSSMRHAYREQGVPFLRSQNVRKNRFEPEGLCFIDPEFHKANPKSAIHPGDVVIVRTGFVGVACVIPETTREANCADLVIVRPGQSLNPYYASHFLNSKSGRERAISASVGSAQKHYNVGAMRKTHIPIPRISDQRRIVSYLDSLQSKLNALKRLQAETAVELCAILPAVLDRAFKGEL